MASNWFAPVIIPKGLQQGFFQEGLYFLEAHVGSSHPRQYCSPFLGGSVVVQCGG